MKPQIRKSIEIYKKENTMEFRIINLGMVYSYEVGEEITTLIKLLDGTKDIKEVYDLLNKKHPQIDYQTFENIIHQMIEDNLIEDNVEQDMFLSNMSLKRYERQISFFEEFSTIDVNKFMMQKKLKESKVVVFGLGGTGSWIVQSLVQAGVGNLHLLDFDNVELSNLSRQVLYTEEQINKLKTVAIKESIAKINTETNIQLTTFKLTEESNIEEIIKDCNLVINCTDYPSLFKTSMWISEKCMKFKIPHIIGGGYRSHIGVIGPTIIPHETACWKCYELSIEPEEEKGQLLKKREENYMGSLNVVSAIVANLQAWDAIRVLIGLNPIIVNKRGEFDFSTLDIKWESFERQEKCCWCGKEVL